MQRLGRVPCRVWYQSGCICFYSNGSGNAWIFSVAWTGNIAEAMQRSEENQTSVKNYFKGDWQFMPDWEARAVRCNILLSSADGDNRSLVLLRLSGILLRYSVVIKILLGFHVRLMSQWHESDFFTLLGTCVYRISLSRSRFPMYFFPTSLSRNFCSGRNEAIC